MGVGDIMHGHDNGVWSGDITSFCGVVYRQMIIKQLTPTILMSQAIENAKKMPPMPAKVWFFWRVTGKMLAR